MHSKDEELGSVMRFLRAQARKLFAAAFWLLLLAAYVWYVRSQDASPQDVALQVRDFLAGSGWGPVLYILLYTVRPLIFFPATVTTAMGGYLWGPLWGGLYASAGANLSATLAYLVGRFFGGDLFAEDEEARSFLARYAQAIRENSFEAVLIMRLIYLPYDMVNYLAGVVRAPWPSYALATLLGILPGSLSFILLGSVFTTDSTAQRWLLAGFSLLTALLGIGFSRWLRNTRRLESAPSS
ncbi:MAG: TVP38/TMEM64 family protein [Caldilineae bacterium]|nr:MAG: TVP38/TMEM64 family protein [Caldilineae bacterium]